MNKYKVLIGLEMHCEITYTNTKVFSPALNRFSEMPNLNISEVELAYPGVLPTLNINALKKALTASIILNCEVPKYAIFERKNYYYPDLPKGYQITQETKPYPVGSYGEINYFVSGIEKKVRINNIHLEEDTASLDHFDNHSMIDYNRAGVPLLELVTEPDFNTADEAVAFLEMIRQIYRYAEISEADIKKGHFRCDVNISVMDASLDDKNPNNYGVRVEVKNVNSISAVRDVIEYESARQIKLLEQNKKAEIMQETRRWDEALKATVFMRDKQNALDYKYFVEPNIPPYEITDKLLEEIKEGIPVLPNERLNNYLNNYNLSLIDATNLVKDKEISDYYESLLKLEIDPIIASNWVLTNIIGYLNKENITVNDFYLKPSDIKIIIDNINNNILSSKQAKEVFIKALEEKKSPIEFINKEDAQESDEEVLSAIISKILDDNKTQVGEYKNGRTNLFQFFIGSVMKETKGKANPVLTRKILEEKLK